MIDTAERRIEIIKYTRTYIEKGNNTHCEDLDEKFRVASGKGGHLHKFARDGLFQERQRVPIIKNNLIAENRKKNFQQNLSCTINSVVGMKENT